MARIANGGVAVGTARKSVYSAILERGYGTEPLSLFSEHGTHALQPGGSYSLAPYLTFLKLGHEVINRIHKENSNSQGKPSR